MDFRHRVLACATTWRRPSPPAPSPIVDYYASPGGAGDYAEASTALATETLFPGAAADNSFAGWFWFDAGAESYGSIFCTPNAGQFSEVSGSDSYFGLQGAGNYFEGDAITGVWVHCVVTFEASGAREGWALFVDGVEVAAPLSGYLEGVTGLLSLFAQAPSHNFPAAGRARNIHIFDRALTSGEIAALYAAGETHNVRAASGAWAGETALVSWDTAAVGGVVLNTGSGGTCGLTLNGAVTSEVDP